MVMTGCLASPEDSNASSLFHALNIGKASGENEILPLVVAHTTAVKIIEQLVIDIILVHGRKTIVYAREKGKHVIHGR